MARVMRLPIGVGDPGTRSVYDAGRWVGSAEKVRLYLDLFAAGWGYRYFISGDVCRSGWRPSRTWAGRAGRRELRRQERLFRSAAS